MKNDEEQAKLTKNKLRSVNRLILNLGQLKMRLERANNKKKHC